MALQHFLLLYNLRKQALEEVIPFEDDITAATRAYAELESEYRKRLDHDDFEIVLVGADSLDTVKLTHSRYFDGGLMLPRLTVPT